jgi:hypothetical protein
MLTVQSNARTTIVNAAFLQEVKDSNLKLWSVLRELRDLRVGGFESRELSRELVELLGELRDAIALEFSLEETYGFIEGSARIGGIGMPDASLAKHQHRELYLQLHELCERVEEAQYRGTISRELSKYLEDFDRFDVAFRTHEEFEAELIRCAFGFRSPNGG